MCFHSKKYKNVWSFDSVFVWHTWATIPKTLVQARILWTLGKLPSAQKYEDIIERLLERYPSSKRVISNVKKIKQCFF